MQDKTPLASQAQGISAYTSCPKGIEKEVRFRLSQGEMQRL